MKRTQIYLQEDMASDVRTLAHRQGRSAAAVIREAIRAYLVEHGGRPLGLLKLKGSGREIWADDEADGYVDRLREEWRA